MADESKSYRDVVSRRRFVELTGVAGAAALAGCDGDGQGSPTETDTSGDDGTDTGTDGSMEQPQYPNQRHNGVTTATPADLQFNISNSSDLPEISQFLLFERFAQYNYTEGAFVPAAVTDWEFTGDTFEMTLRDDLTWSNGEPVTSEDVRVQLELAIQTGGSISNWAGSVETPDETTAVINIDGDINPGIVESDVFAGRWLSQDRFTYKDKLQAIKDGGEERLSEFRTFSDSDPITCGPFTLENRDDQAMLTSHFSESPWASNINFGEYAFNRLGGNTARQQALVELQTDSDYSLAAPARIVANFPDAVEEVRFPDVFGVGLTPNHDHAHVGDRAVRQAIAYAIDREQCVQNSYPRAKKSPGVETGIATDVQDKWLGDAKSSYNTYGQGERMTDEAASVMQEAGYEKVDGTWQDGDGNTVSLPVSVPGGWTDWVLVAETVVSHLNEFGFDASLRSLSSGEYWPTKNSGDFVLLLNTWLHGGPTTYPYFSLLHQLWEPQLHVAKYNYPPATDTSAVGGSEEDLTVPAREGSGTMTLSTGDVVEELATASEDADIQSLVRRLAWAANQDLPMIPVTEKRLQSFVTSDDWDVPMPLSEDPDARVSWTPTWLPRKGKMNYKGN